MCSGGGRSGSTITGVTITDATGVEVTGLDISGTDNAVQIRTTIAGTFTANVHDNTISDAGGHGIDGLTTAGELRLALDANTGITAGGSGSVDILQTDASGGVTPNVAAVAQFGAGNFAGIEQDSDNATALITQGTMKMARMMPRPANSRWSASARAKPSTNAIRVDATVQITVLSVTRQNTLLVRMVA